MSHFVEVFGIFLVVAIIVGLVIAGFVAVAVSAMGGSLYTERGGGENVSDGPTPFERSWPHEDDSPLPTVSDQDLERLKGVLDYRQTTDRKAVQL